MVAGHPLPPLLARCDVTAAIMNRRGVRLGEDWERSPLGLLVPARDRPYRDRPVAIDLFAGCGGFSCGFHQAGWQVIGALEMDPYAAITYLVNLGRPARYGGVRMHFDTDERGDAFEKRCQIHLGLKGAKGAAMSASAERPVKGKLNRGGMLAGEGWLAGQSEQDQRHGCEHFWVADVRNLTGAQILDAIGMDQGDVGAIIGGPPCQGFSNVGKRNVMDPRNSLVFEFARLVCEIMPRTFVMENVPGIESMVTAEGVPVLDAFCHAVSDGGYGEYEALRRALGTTGGRAGVKGSKRSKPANPEAPHRRAKKADGGQLDLDLFGASGGDPS